MAANHQQWRALMDREAFKQKFHKAQNLSTKVVKAETKCWFLKSCQVQRLVPPTLHPRIQDPAAHRAGYSQEEAQNWAKAQVGAGLRFVQEALRREEENLAKLRLEERKTQREVEATLNDEEWLVFAFKIESLKHSNRKVRRREHGGKLRALLAEQGRRVPNWLNRTARSFLENISLMRRGEEEEDEAEGPQFMSTPARGRRQEAERTQLAEAHEAEDQGNEAQPQAQEAGGRRQVEESLLHPEGVRRIRPRRRKRTRRKYQQMRRKLQRPLDQKLYFNYTDIPLTPAMKSVINLGPGFVPDRATANPVNIQVGALRMRRNMRYDLFFQEKEKKERAETGEEDREQGGEEEQEIRVLADKEVRTDLPRKWNPPGALKDFETANLFNLTSPANLAKIHPNISPLQRAAIKDMQKLSAERVWIIKPSDKSGGLTFLPFKAYDETMKGKLREEFSDGEGNLQPKYPKSSKAALKREFKRIGDLVKEGVDKGWVNEKDGKVAMPSEPKAGRLYGQTKNHKPILAETGIPPLREIVSCSGSNVEGLGKLVDHRTRPVDESAPSFLQDTPDLLRQIELLNREGPQPAGTTLFSVDVVALYPSVPTQRAPEVLRQRLLKAGLGQELVDWLVRCTIALLECNTFEYDGELYTQRDGAGIGQPQAASYAGIFMAHVEQEGLRRWAKRGRANPSVARGKGRQWKRGDRAEVDFWRRFRDDCLGLWRGTEAEFIMFINTLNSVDPNIKFTHEIDFTENKIAFLDTMISIDSDGFLQTDIYHKPNTVNQLLSPRSAHPSFVTRSSVYSLALRLKRICSKEEWFEKAAKELEEKLRVRGYKKAVVEAGIAKARAVSRLDAIKKVEMTRGEGSERQHRLIIEYDRRSCPALATILKNNYDAATAGPRGDSRFQTWFPKVPKPVYKRGTNIKQLLCRSKLPPARNINTRASARENQRGITRCNKGLNRNTCSFCPILTSSPREVIKEVKVHSSGQTIQIEEKINCKTKNFLYLVESKKTPKGPGSPPSQYAGQSGNTVKGRGKQHLDSIEDQDESKVVGKHFKETHSTRNDFVFTPFMKLKSDNPWVRLHYERQFMNQHGGIDKFLNVNL